MRERVQEVAKRLGYTSGRAPVRDSLLALMVNGVANPYNASLIRGVESQARAAGSSLIVGDSPMDRRWSWPTSSGSATAPRRNHIGLQSPAGG